MKDNRIQVLWVENEKDIVDTFPDEAYQQAEIWLKPFSCWDEAKKALKSDYTQWDAIILDAKCKVHDNDADIAPRFLTNAQKDILTLAKHFSQTIPWYVLTGQREEEITDNIPEDIEWNNDWFIKQHRHFYSKTGYVQWGGEEKLERLILWERIRSQVLNNNPKLQIENDLYREVFNALEALGLYENVGNNILPLLIPIHFGETSNENYNERYVHIRKSIEYIFRNMLKMGILPESELIHTKTKKKDSINLSWCSLFLGGEQPSHSSEVSENDHKLWIQIKRNIQNPILPKQLADWLKSAVFQVGGAVHTTVKDEEITMNLDNYLPHVNGSPYMLRSLTMGLCDFIIWYYNFIKENPDAEKNAAKFWTLLDE